ncbi:MAG: hypothetical protein AAGH83_08055 [Pseudomonadota bacterium]
MTMRPEQPPTEAFSEGPRPAFKGLQPATPPSLVNDEAYHDFVRSLVAKVEGRWTGDMNEEVQIEISKLMVLLADMPRKQLSATRVHFEAAFDILGSEHPNVFLARGIRRKLQAITDSSVPGVTWLISRISGKTPLNAVISALLTALLAAIALLAVIVTGHGRLVSDAEAVSELETLIRPTTFNLLLVMVNAAFLGGIVSITARIRDFLQDSSVSTPFVYVAVVRKPFLAACYAILAFMVLQSGLVSIPGVSMDGASAPFVAWSVGFICGFSERFSEDFVFNVSDRVTPPTGMLGQNPTEPPVKR